MEKVIAFHPELVEILGDIQTAIYFQQLYYWRDKGGRKDGYVYKSKKEIEKETTLSRFHQDKARKKLVELGWISVKKFKANGAPTLHFKCLYELSLISKPVTNGKVTELPMEKRLSYQSITENTTENTTDIYSESENSEKSLLKPPNSNTLAVKNNKTNVQPEKNVTTGSNDSDFVLKDAMETLRTSKVYLHRIIYAYFVIKGYEFDNKAQFNKAFKEQLAHAKNLEGYDKQDIIDTMNHLKAQDVSWEWKLTTVVKTIDDFRAQKQSKKTL